MFAALVAMLGFTSCLDSDGGSNTSSTYGIMKVNGFAGSFYFTDISGFTYTPSNQAALATSGLDNYQYAYIMGTYDGSTLLEGATQVSIDLYGASPVKSFSSSIDTSSEMEEYANAPLLAAGSDVGSQTNIQFFTNRDIFVPVSYFYKSYSNNDDLRKEFNKHEFHLFYDREGSNATMLKMALRHRVQDPEVNKERKTSGSEYLHFNITPVLSAYGSDFSTTPTTIQVEYQYNYINGEMADEVILHQVEVNYQDWLNLFDKLNK